MAVANGAIRPAAMLPLRFSFLSFFPANPLTMNPVKGNGQILQKRTEWTFKGAFPANQDIFVTGAGLLWSNLAYSLAQPPFDPVADNGIAQLLCRGKSKTGENRLPLLAVMRIDRAFYGLQYKPGSGKITTVSCLEKV